MFIMMLIIVIFTINVIIVNIVIFYLLLLMLLTLLESKWIMESHLHQWVRNEISTFYYHSTFQPLAEATSIDSRTFSWNFPWNNFFVPNYGQMVEEWNTKVKEHATGSQKKNFFFKNILKKNFSLNLRLPLALLQVDVTCLTPWGRR